MKFGRTFVLKAEGQSGKTHTFEYPLTLKFSVERNVWATANTGHFTIYGLGEQTRKDIIFDQLLSPKINRVTGLPFFTVELYAGYVSQSHLPLVFTGNINLAYTSRQRSDLITHIEAFDGGFGIRNGVYTQTFKDGWDYTTEMTKAMRAAEKWHLKAGKVVVTPKPKPGVADVFNGNILNVLLTKFKPEGGDVFVDKGVINILGQTDVLPNAPVVPILSAKTGLINVPKKSGYNLSCDCVFEPSFNIGEKLAVESTLNPQANGEYKIIGISHEGTISGVESDSVTTHLSLLSTKASLK